MACVDIRVGIGRVGLVGRVRGVVARPQGGRQGHGRPGARQRPPIAPRLGTPQVGTRAIQPNEVEVQVAQKDVEDVGEVGEGASAGEPESEPLSSASGPTVVPAEKPRRRGRPRKVRDVDGVVDYGGAGRGGRENDDMGGSNGRVEGRVLGQQALRKERKSFSTFVKELFDAQTSNAKKQDDKGERDEVPTELIFKLTRRGYGWGEEIIPQLTVERRPVKAAASAKRKKTGEMKVLDDDPECRLGRRVNGAEGDEEGGQEEASSSQGGSPETVLNAYLIDIGVPEQDVERLVNSAVAWRMTPGGRPLIDRRRQSRLTRNVKIVTKYLVDKCDVPLGKNGVASVFMRTPELMLCKPSNNDRWDRRAVELAAFLLKNGHCNVPEVFSENQELGMWVKRQRVTRAAGQLSQERLTILERMGFEFGDLAQVTEEWETRFDMLVDWVLWHGESGETFSWDLINWGKKGGITARELALWISLQREFYRRQLLPAEAVQRFEAVHGGWMDDGASSEEDRWMHWLGRLVYVIERRRLAMRSPPTGRGNPFSSKRAGSMVVRDATNGMSGSGGSGAGSVQDSRASVARKQVVNTVSSRREAATRSPFSEDPGLRFWLSRQRWMWRKSKLDPERVKMLQLAGIDVDIYPADDWRRMAHLAAERLQGATIDLPFVTYNDYEDVRVVDGDRALACDPEAPVPGNTRLQVLRWVETQRALFVDGRLSPGQLRYLTFLGLTWVLSDKVVDADDANWLSKWKTLKPHLGSADEQNQQMSFDMQDWITQQRAMCYLNMLDEPRKSKLLSLGIDLGVKAAEPVWNARLSELFAHTQEVGHAEVSKEDRPELYAWLERCALDYREERLSPTKAAQLKCLGVKLPI